ncbi:exonuclease II Exo2 [Coemansia sp. RSA 2675]|uniref:Exonuclease II Exo2 n=1 Tax=Coemansia linderi TaxID=2663919 RepID=A0ACC1KJA0_9FUNG|nr:exonuclease II Exo2 [Coemansia sp. RSA 2675]KAJ2790635.1 exonuclease II Exo2 [Coemansia linderi]
MGIPKFFRWLSGRYPLVCERISDDNIPEFDNLYLDMNGIIHNCTHPKDGETPAPATDEERFLAIFYYIDFLFNKIRPQKVFFLGIDGVAPRAKMNEQRARRFRTARELEELHAKELAERRAKGEVIRPEDEESSEGVFDPTCITPGTEFMDKLTEALRYYINKRVSEDANWRKPQIILSAPNVPGEGEHKIMDYIRFSRAQPGYSPNVRHCLYGLDADLIMLGLLSHEPHFSLLREEVLFGGRGQKSGAAADPSMQAFYLLHISVLRDYLDHEFSGLKSELGCSSQYAAMERDNIAGVAQQGDGNAFDLERIIDDYILMIMLVGNDFLPNLPKLSINGGALNFMFATYTRIRPSLGGYLHDNGILNLERLEVFMREIAKFEVDSFKLEVANHQWYQVYKQKAVLRGETPDESSVVSELGGGRGRGRGGGRHRHDRRGLGAGPDTNGDLEIDYDSVLGEAATPIKGNQLVISKSQQEMLEVIRRFAQRALPKAAAAGHKVQMQFLPGPTSELDNLIIKRAADLLGLHVGHEYAHDGSLTLYVAVGSPKAIAKLELEDSESAGDESRASSVINFVSSSATSFQALGALEDGESDDELRPRATEGSAVPDFVESVRDVTDEVAVAEYVAMRLRELDNVLVVPDAELNMYTQTGDVSDFWQRFELWKAAYYGAKLEIVYDAPNIAEEASGDSGLSSATASGQRFRPPAATVEPMCRSYIGSLQWVLQYYYRGCQSWSWYYPYHYAPCISDICANLAAYKVEHFVNDEPYTPYEQLMCVLPPYSRKLLPSALRSLMVDMHSPIHDMYPTSFSVDMNGKKMPWEAVVLIDFVDAERIRDAMRPRLQQLSSDEQRRNSRGTNMAYSYTPISVEDDAENAPQYLAPCNLKFPPIRPLKCKGVIYILPSLKAKGGRAELELVSGLIRGASTRAKMLSGFPSLFTVRHNAQLAFNGTEVFGSPSRDESMQIELLPNAPVETGSAEGIAHELLNGKRTSDAYRPRRLFVAWPYLRDAVLVGVSDISGTYTMDARGTNIIFLEHGGAGERQVWTRRYMEAVHQAKKTQAVITPDNCKVLLHVLHLRGLEMFPDGSLVRDYGFPASGGADPSRPWAGLGMWSEAGVQSYPASLVLTDLSGAWVNNPRFAEHEAVPLDQAFAIKDRAFFLGRTPLYGSPGKVIGHAYDDAGCAVGVDLQLVANVDFGASKYSNFLGVNVLAQLAKAGCERYLPSYAVAREIGVSPLLLSRITSKMMLMDESKTGDSARVHIGLDLKFEAKRLKVSGFTRRGPTGWQFSDRAVDLIVRYKAAFPRMFAQLETTKSNSSLLTAGECFRPEQATDNARAYVSSEVKRVRQWLKDNIDHSTMVQVPIESDLLSKDQVGAIVAARAGVRAAATKKVIIRGVRREAALRPVDAQHLLKSQSLMVGHRVAYVSDRSGSVPFGAKGYIVGIHARESAQSLDSSVNSNHVAKLSQEGVPADMIAAVEILLDQPFIDGTTLDGRCPPQRGALVRPYQVLDLTSWGLGQNVASKPTALPRSVDAIVPAPNTVHQKHSATAGQTADVAAKARVHFGRSARVSVVGAEGGSGVSSVSVPEPPQAPWAGTKPANPQQAAKDRNQDHASKIMSQLLGGLSAQAPPFKPSGAKPPAVAKPAVDDDQHAQSIISKLLAGPMERMSIATKAPATGTPLAAHPPVSGQCPLVIEDEYLSDSMDEDDAGESARSKRVPAAAQPRAPVDARFYYNYSNDRPPSSDHRGRGRGRGTARGRGGARGAHVPGSSDSSQARLPSDGSSTWRGRGRGRGRGNPLGQGRSEA